MDYIPATYQTPGRVSVDFIAIHWINGTLDSCIKTFTDGERQASAHYGVEDARVVQFVRDENTAWSLGNWEANQRSISIEHSAQPGRPATDATYTTSIALIADLCRKHGLAPGNMTIRPHGAYQATQCPGTMDLDRIITGVQALMYGENEDDMPSAADVAREILDFEVNQVGGVPGKINLGALLAEYRHANNKIVENTSAWILPEVLALREIVSKLAVQQGVSIDYDEIARKVADETAKRLAA